MVCICLAGQFYCTRLSAPSFVVVIGDKASSVEVALVVLDAALADMRIWNAQAQEGKQLLNDILRSRHAAAENHTLLRCACIGISLDLHMSCKITAA